eukprot:CAMPEP_0202686318 /NCGR_PEP_ID=MMETSP1385-20130828/2139_1 /ASSEMBLY_ACC=CAM_ASM_000861 /TAXON_ID=933848 /ORGANISM="Elphidium margaritaceum" /LENGTH=91 /DNA_ID=CAMNT_0049340877 /DNA_START=110 /DNA_END=385 /DNA_ORIENTATION=+
MSQPPAAQKVGGVRHKAHKAVPPKPDKDSGVAPPIDALFNTQPKIQGAAPPDGSPKQKAKQVHTNQKMKEPKNINNKHQNNPKINQPKQGY